MTNPAAMPEEPTPEESLATTPLSPPQGAEGVTGEIPERLTEQPAANTSAESMESGLPYRDGYGAIVIPHEKPTIQLAPGRTQDNLEAAGRLLAATGQHYRRGNAIVTLKPDPKSKQLAIQEASKDTLQVDLDTLAKWERPGGRDGEWKRFEPPARFCDKLTQEHCIKHLPPIEGMAHQPFLRGDGSVCTASGYDPLTGLFAAFEPSDFEVPDSPTRAQAEASLQILLGVLEEFPFAEEVDRAAAVSAMLTAAVRASLPGAPMFHVRAHQAGTGKSYLSRVITAFATARAARPMPFPATNVECQKVLLATLRDSPEVVELDNLIDDLVAHDSLCSVLTAENYAGRPLMQSHILTVGTRALFLSSGNNVGPIGDMTRRCVTIRLDPQVEQPATRKIKNKRLLEDVRDSRARFVSAALTIVRAWIASGAVRACVDLASFDAWSHWCREPLVWLGMPDPATSTFTTMHEDPDRELLGRLLEMLSAEFGSTPVMVRDMIKLANDIGKRSSEELRDVLQEITGDRYINAKRLGHWVKRHAGQIVDGRKLTPAVASRNSKVWRVIAA